jgi:hypothetical protein
LLLLGAGESGKSTIFKQVREAARGFLHKHTNMFVPQMKVIYGKPLTEEERKHYTQIVFTNVIVFMKELNKQVDKLGLKSKLGPVEGAYDSVSNLSDYDPISPSVADKIKQLWQSSLYQQVYERRSEFQVVDSHKVHTLTPVAAASSFPSGVCR